MESDARMMLKQIPSVDRCLQDSRLKDSLTQLSRVSVVDCIREVQDEQREIILNSSSDKKFVWSDDSFFELVLERLKIREQGYLRRVINATGIIVHTNLGRSLFSEVIGQRVKELTSTYTNLEYDLEKGKRSSRYEHLVPLLRSLTGYEDSLIVNNNAAAVLLLLDTFASGKEVIISRSELVEIGGGFRIPDVMKKAGVKLVEVGCTNKTYIRDYEAAITPETVMILKVHRSNFQIQGFTAEPSMEELAAISRKHDLLFMFDLGSGNLLPHDFPVRINEPGIRSCLQHIDVVTFSGDKLLAGPQAGIILASTRIVDTLKKNQILRALRVDKMCIAALEATLELYQRETAELIRAVPTLRMLNEPLPSITERAEKMVKTVRAFIGDDFKLSIQPGYSQLGGGGLPHEQFPTNLIAISSKNKSASTLEQAFRAQIPPVICRIVSDQLMFDLRTVQQDEEELLLNAIRDVCSQK